MCVKLSFIPADLHLSTESDGQFVVTLKGTEIFRSLSMPKPPLQKRRGVPRTQERRGMTGVGQAPVGAPEEKRTQEQRPFAAQGKPFEARGKQDVYATGSRRTQEPV